MFNFEALSSRASVERLHAYTSLSLRWVVNKVYNNVFKITIWIIFI
nr:MAG TPA: hypothetical protein [Caudoviricetes sp.]